jgi:predicted Zn-dependent protease
MKRGFYLAQLCAVLMMGLCCVAPVQAQGLNLFKQPSPDQQKKVGDQAAQEILAKYPEINDARAKHFRDVCTKLVNSMPDADRKTWNFRFHLIDSKEVNAFALPGGQTFMFTGLYNLIHSDDELAAVMGHELTHVRKQHWAKAEVEQEKRQALLVAGFTIFKANRAEQEVGATITNVIGLKYSRKEEDEADKGGLENLVAAGYNPQGMLDLFATLQKAAGNGGDKLTGDFLSDHPLTSARIDTTKKRIDALGNKTFPALTPLPGSPTKTSSR